MCIASDFKKYDTHAVAHMSRNIELIRYRRYEGLLLFELVHSPDAAASTTTSAARTTSSSEKTVVQYLAQASPVLVERYQTLEDYCLSLGDDVTKKELKNYFAFRRLKNFACIEVHPGGCHLLVYVKGNPREVELLQGVTRDVSNIGHFGTGDLEIRVTDDEHLDVARDLIQRSYEVS